MNSLNPTALASADALFASTANAPVPSNNPYLKGGLDTNDVLRAKLDPEFYEGYCIGSIHKALHAATARFRNDPTGRQRRYQAVLYHAQNLLRYTGNRYGTAGGDMDDLAQRFDRLPTSQRDGRRPSIGPPTPNGAQPAPTPTAPSATAPVSSGPQIAYPQ